MERDQLREESLPSEISCDSALARAVSIAVLVPRRALEIQSSAGLTLGGVDKGDSQQRVILIQRGFCGGRFDAGFDERRGMVLS